MAHEHGAGRKQKRVHDAVEHAAEKVYDNPREFVQEITTNYYDYRDVWSDLRDPENRLIKGGEIPMKAKGGGIVEGSQVWGKSYVRPWKGITQSLSMHMAELAPEGEGKKHGHQNEAMMYILEGEGYELHDGKEYQWEAGNLVLIHGGCVHKHHSVDPENPCRALIVKPKALGQFLHLLYQGSVHDPPSEPGKFPDWTPENYSKTPGETYSREADADRSDKG